MREEAEKFGAPFSSSPDVCRGWNWHLVTPNAFEAGCRGVSGPVPQPLNMRSVASTDADKLMPNLIVVNPFFEKKSCGGMARMPYF